MGISILIALPALPETPRRTEHYHAYLPETLCRRKTHRMGTMLSAFHRSRTLLDNLITDPGTRTSFVCVRDVAASNLSRMPT